MRKALIAVVILIWIILGWFTSRHYDECCLEPLPDTPVEAAAVLPPVVQTVSCDGLICFKKNNCSPIYCDRWISFRDSIISEVGADEKLIIIGFSRPGELNESSYKNLGECRADSIGQAISATGSDIKIETIGQLRVGISSENLCDNVSFRITNLSSKVNETSLIYFPKNSTDKLADASVESYLKQIAEQVKSTDQTIRLTGHTDDRGNKAYNLELGKKRANTIRQYLVDLGVPMSRVLALSKGENEPIANNNTEQGRAKNRRLELEITN